MRAYGYAAGIAFQIIDDVLDIVGSPEEVGKTLGRDLTLGKTTLPTIHCLAHAGALTATALRRSLTNGRTCDRERLAEWLAETESIAYAITTARRFITEALTHLDPLPAGDAKRSLASLAGFILDRHF